MARSNQIDPAVHLDPGSGYPPVGVRLSPQGVRELQEMLERGDAGVRVWIGSELDGEVRVHPDDVQALTRSVDEQLRRVDASIFIARQAGREPEDLGRRAAYWEIKRKFRRAHVPAAQPPSSDPAAEQPAKDQRPAPPVATSPQPASRPHVLSPQAPANAVSAEGIPPEIRYGPETTRTANIPTGSGAEMPAGGDHTVQVRLSAPGMRQLQDVLAHGGAGLRVRVGGDLDGKASIHPADLGPLIRVVDERLAGIDAGIFAARHAGRVPDVRDTEHRAGNWDLKRKLARASRAQPASGAAPTGSATPQAAAPQLPPAGAAGPSPHAARPGTGLGRADHLTARPEPPEQGQDPNGPVSGNPQVAAVGAPPAPVADPARPATDPAVIDVRDGRFPDEATDREFVLLAGSVTYTDELKHARQELIAVLQAEELPEGVDLPDREILRNRLLYLNRALDLCWPRQDIYVRQLRVGDRLQSTAAHGDVLDLTDHGDGEIWVHTTPAVAGRGSTRVPLHPGTKVQISSREHGGITGPPLGAGTGQLPREILLGRSSSTGRIPPGTEVEGPHLRPGDIISGIDTTTNTFGWMQVHTLGQNPDGTWTARGTRHVPDDRVVRGRIVSGFGAGHGEPMSITEHRKRLHLPRTRFTMIVSLADTPPAVEPHQDEPVREPNGEAPTFPARPAGLPGRDQAPGFGSLEQVLAHWAAGGHVNSSHPDIAYHDERTARAAAEDFTAVELSPGGAFVIGQQVSNGRWLMKAAATGVSAAGHDVVVLRSRQHAAAAAQALEEIRIAGQPFDWLTPGLPARLRDPRHRRELSAAVRHAWSVRRPQLLTERGLELDDAPGPDETTPPVPESDPEPPPATGDPSPREVPARPDPASPTPVAPPAPSPAGLPETRPQDVPSLPTAAAAPSPPPGGPAPDVSPTPASISPPARKSRTRKAAPARERRFISAEQVLQHWRSGGEEETRADQHRLALWASVLEPTARISAQGSFLIAKHSSGTTSATWGVWHSATGDRLTTAGTVGHAVAITRACSTIQIAGEPFDWDSPGYRDRATAADFQEALERAIQGRSGPAPTRTKKPATQKPTAVEGPGDRDPQPPRDTTKTPDPGVTAPSPDPRPVSAQPSEPAGPPTLPAGPDESTAVRKLQEEFTAGEWAQIRIMVDDWAGMYTKTIGLEGAIRYIADVLVEDLQSVHDLPVIWGAVAAELDRNPDSLTHSRTPSQIRERDSDRAAAAERLTGQARTALETGSYDAATTLVNEAEQHAPLGADYEQIRALIRTRRKASTEGSPTPVDPDRAQPQDLSPSPPDTTSITSPADIPEFTSQQVRAAVVAAQRLDRLFQDPSQVSLGLRTWELTARVRRHLLRVAGLQPPPGYEWASEDTIRPTVTDSLTLAENAERPDAPATPVADLSTGDLLKEQQGLHNRVTTGEKLSDDGRLHASEQERNTTPERQPAPHPTPNPDAEAQNTKPRRFTSVKQVLDHWRSGGDGYKHLWKDEVARQADNLKSAQLSPAGTFIVGKDSNGFWVVRHSGTSIMPGIGQNKNRREALARAQALEEMQVDGKPFNWDSEGLADRMSGKNYGAYAAAREDAEGLQTLGLALDEAERVRQIAAETGASEPAQTMEVASEPEAFTGFAPGEQAQIRYAVDDWAGYYYGRRGEINAFTRDDATRYVTEGHLEDLCANYGFGTVREAVAAEIERNPEALTHSSDRSEIDARVAAREQESVRLATEAHTAYRDGDFDRALDLIDQAEQMAPIRQGYGSRGYNLVRTQITQQIAIRAASTENTSNLSPEPTTPAPEHPRAATSRAEADAAEADPPQHIPEPTGPENDFPGHDPGPHPQAPAVPAGATGPASVEPGPGVALPGEKYPPTGQQQAIIDAVLAGQDVIVQAKAGTGKTSTLEALARRVHVRDPAAAVAYIAFNKSVQVEGERRMPSNTESRTGHSIAFTWAPRRLKDRINAKNPIRRPDEIAAHLNVNAALPVDDEDGWTPPEQAMAAERAVDAWANSSDDDLTRAHLPELARRLPHASQDVLVRIAQQAWADRSAPGGRLRLTLDHVRKMWALSRPDFTQPGSGLRRPASILVLDEAQDTPPVLAKVVTDQAMQTVIVGDGDQAIYGFTGAVDFLSTARADVELPLTKSWRFGPPIADIANQVLTLLGSRTLVEGGGTGSRVITAGTMQAADAVLVRSNSGAIAEIIREQQAGRTVAVPKGTKTELNQLVETARYLKGQARAPERMHEDLAPFRTWAEVTATADHEGDPKLQMLVRMVQSKGLDELDAVVQQVTEIGQEPLAGVRFRDVSDGLIAEGNTWEVKQHLRKAGFEYLELPASIRTPKKTKGWITTGTMAERDATMQRARELAVGAVADVIVSTAHKAKGLEWDRVRIGDDFRPATDDATGELIVPEPEELRLIYVALTRACKELDPGPLAWVNEGAPHQATHPGPGAHATPTPAPAHPDPDPTPPAPPAPGRPPGLDQAVRDLLARIDGRGIHVHAGHSDLPAVQEALARGWLTLETHGFDRWAYLTSAGHEYADPAHLSPQNDNPQPDPTKPVPDLADLSPHPDPAPEAAPGHDDTAAVAAVPLPDPDLPTPERRSPEIPTGWVDEPAIGELAVEAARNSLVVSVLDGYWQDLQDADARARETRSRGDEGLTAQAAKDRDHQRRRIAAAMRADAHRLDAQAGGHDVSVAARASYQQGAAALRRSADALDTRDGLTPEQPVSPAATAEPGDHHDVALPPLPEGMATEQAGDAGLLLFYAAMETPGLRHDFTKARVSIHEAGQDRAHQIAAAQSLRTVAGSLDSDAVKLDSLPDLTDDARANRRAAARFRQAADLLDGQQSLTSPEETPASPTDKESQQEEIKRGRPPAPATGTEDGFRGDPAATDGLSEGSAPETLHPPRPTQTGRPRAGDTLTFHEFYGNVSKGQLRAYQRHNVSPSDHDDLVDIFGAQNHRAIEDAVKDPANHEPHSTMLSIYLLQQNIRDRADEAEAGPQGKNGDHDRDELHADRSGALAAVEADPVRGDDPAGAGDLLRGPGRAGPGAGGLDLAEPGRTRPGRGKQRAEDGPAGDGPGERGIGGDPADPAARPRDRGPTGPGSGRPDAGTSPGLRGVEERDDSPDPPDPDLPAAPAPTSVLGTGLTAGAAPYLPRWPDAPAFHPTGQHDLAPAGLREKALANIAVVQTLRILEGQDRPATGEEQQVLARWAGWGALAEPMFSDKPAHAATYATERAQLTDLLTGEHLQAARRSTMNAHYTDATIVTAMWQALADLGFRGGQVLEPGSGAGTFIGFAPPGTAMVGVELDATTAMISRYLYPAATVLTQSLADFTVPAGTFDAAIGNVPFARVKPFDRIANPGRRHSLHNLAIIKAVTAIRAGGIIALLTSRYTLDSQNDLHRQTIHDHADLIGAIRLPSGAHQSAANTKVVTDLLLLRRRRPGEPVRDADWLEVTELDTDDDGRPITLNKHFVDHPDMVLGQVRVGVGEKGRKEIQVVGGPTNLGQRLRETLARVTAAAAAEDLTYTPPVPGQEPIPISDLLATRVDQPEGHLDVGVDGQFRVVRAGQWQPVEIPPGQTERLGELLGLRDAVIEVLERDRSTAEDTPETIAARSHLQALYARYLEQYQAVNDSRWVPTRPQDVLLDEPQHEVPLHLLTVGDLIAWPPKEPGGRPRRAVVTANEPLAQLTDPQWAPGGLEEQITTLYGQLATTPGQDWVHLDDIHQHLSGIPTATVDAALNRLRDLDTVFIAEIDSTLRGPQPNGDPPPAGPGEHLLIRPPDAGGAAAVSITVDVIGVQGGARRQVLAPHLQTVTVIGQRQERQRLARQAPPIFERDPQAGLVFALESYDPDTNTSTPGTLLTARTLCRAAEPGTITDPDDTLSLVLDGNGHIDLGRVADLMGVDEVAARHLLGTRVFHDPDLGRLVTQEEYLSGDVRTKLRAAELAAVAAGDDPTLTADIGSNIEALQGALPEWMGPDRVRAALGAAWISVDVVQQFLRELVDDPKARVVHGGSVWTITGSRSTADVLVGQEWGTEDRSAYEILESLLHRRTIRITRINPDGSKYVDQEATDSAIARAEKMQDRFRAWVWEDPQRSQDLLTVYNNQFNTLVPRIYSTAPLRPQGMSSTFTLFGHQAAAVRRILHEETVVLAHDVGAGKTLTMATAAMELRRLGHATKPAIVVPSHMKEQWQREFLTGFPQAKLLAVSSEDLDKKGRAQFLATIATGDWDAVIITKDAFKAIEVSKATYRDYINRELKEMGQTIQATRHAIGDTSPKGDSSDPTVKKMEAQLAAREERLKAKLDRPRDQSFTFEQLGIDYLFVDEAHLWKNLERISATDEALTGSDIATDLDLKLGYLREVNTSGRLATLATATPFSNSLGEIHTMLKYTRPQELRAAGVYDFDVFLSTFAKAETKFEMSADGGSWVPKTRLRRWFNLSGLLRIWLQTADVMTKKQLDLDIPDIDGGRPEIVVVPASDWLKQHYMPKLIRRSETSKTGRHKKGQDNILVINSDGKAAALDPRMVGGPPDPAGGKLGAVADKAAQIWAETQDNLYLDPATGGMHPRPGALQILFLDQGTPGADIRYAKKIASGKRPVGDTVGFDAYAELKAQLVARGVPAEQIAFMHDAGGRDDKKAALFRQARTGGISILIASTALMGVGTNVQDRDVAVMHIDCPPRPSDIAQRNGRGERHGNLNGTLRILQFATEGSLDVRLWDAQERKAAMIEPVMRGDLSIDEVEELSPTVLNAAEMKAAISGNPTLLHKVATDQDLHTARVRADDHHRARQYATSTITTSTAVIARDQETAATIRQTAARLTRSPSSPIGYTIALGPQGHSPEKRAAGNDIIRQQAVRALQEHSPTAYWGDRFSLGQIAGHEIEATTYVNSAKHLWFRLSVRSLIQLMGESATISVPADAVPTADWLKRLTHLFDGLENYAQHIEAAIPDLRRNITNAERQLEKTFTDAPRLAALEKRADRLTRLLTWEASKASAAASPTPPPNRPGDRTDQETPGPVPGGPDTPAASPGPTPAADEPPPRALTEDPPDVIAVLGELGGKAELQERPAPTSLRNITADGIPIPRTNSWQHRRIQIGSRRPSPNLSQIYKITPGLDKRPDTEVILYTVQRIQKDWVVYSPTDEYPLTRNSSRQTCEDWALAQAQDLNQAAKLVKETPHQTPPTRGTLPGAVTTASRPAPPPMTGPGRPRPR